MLISLEATFRARIKNVLFSGAVWAVFVRHMAILLRVPDVV
jgi:hypothetical protein